VVSKEIFKAEDSGKKSNYIIVSPKNIRIPKISDEKTPASNSNGGFSTKLNSKF
jgi:hypothetical protein